LGELHAAGLATVNVDDLDVTADRWFGGARRP
jgi:hypothetical protein